uniref:Uncharacterized protein n=1 Tax=Rhipicephalus appendiculatus TaxID=34631 RepID=A0A131YGQ2_RHIAP
MKKVSSTRMAVFLAASAFLLPAIQDDSQSCTSAAPVNRQSLGAPPGCAGCLGGLLGRVRAPPGGRPQTSLRQHLGGRQQPVGRQQPGGGQQPSGKHQPGVRQEAGIRPGPVPRSPAVPGTPRGSSPGSSPGSSLASPGELPGTFGRLELMKTPT